MFSRADGLAPSRTPLAFVAAGWAMALAPMTTLGFGSDVDGWLIGQRAFQMWATGTYAGEGPRTIWSSSSMTRLRCCSAAR